MKRLTLRRPSPATVISCIALFVSLGGVSYGVATGFIDTREIKDETIRSKDVRNNALLTQDIRNNEVRGRDIRNSTVISGDVGLNSLTGSDVLESSLSRVPEADTLDGIDSTGFVPADVVGFAPVPFGPAGGSAAGEPAAAFDVDPLGFTHLQGVLTANGGAGALGILPPGSRPAARSRFAVYSDPATALVAPAESGAVAALLTVEPNGEISAIETAANGTDLALDGITFRAGG